MQVSDGYLRYMIKNGKTGTQMKPFSSKSELSIANLTDLQVEDVIAYLRTNVW